MRYSKDFGIHNNARHINELLLIYPLDDYRLFSVNGFQLTHWKRIGDIFYPCGVIQLTVQKQTYIEVEYNGKFSTARFLDTLISDEYFIIDELFFMYEDDWVEELGGWGLCDFQRDYKTYKAWMHAVTNFEGANYYRWNLEDLFQEIWNEDIWWDNYHGIPINYTLQKNGIREIVGHYSGGKSMQRKANLRKFLLEKDCEDDTFLKQKEALLGRNWKNTDLRGLANFLIKQINNY